MKIALFGGSFNPIHRGHVLLARAVVEELHYQKIIFMTALTSPFKTTESLQCSPLDRLNMTRCAIEEEKEFECSDYEIWCDEPSFTIKTIGHIYSLYGREGRTSGSEDCIEGKLGLIIGSDQLLQFKKWKDYDEILKLCDLIVAGRKSEDERKEEWKIKSEDVDFDFYELQTPIMPVSSSRIRHIIRKEKNWKHRLSGKLLNPKIATYIEENALYGCDIKLAFPHLESLIEDVATYAKSELSERRFLHSLRVASMAERLAITYPHSFISPRLAYLAGVAHDITKEKSDEWQKKTVQAENESIDEVESEHLRLLHGKTAAILLRKYFGLKHRSLLDAIKNHTFAHPLLDDLGKMLYIADKIEEGRCGVEEVREMVGICTLNEIMIALLEKSEELLKAKNAVPHRYAVELLKRLKK